MNHEDLVELGFKLLGEEENDPFYLVRFNPPFNFGVTYLSGVLENGVFWLWSNDVKYTDKEELKKVIDVVGGEKIIEK